MAGFEVTTHGRFWVTAEGWLQIRLRADAHENENELRDLLSLFCLSKTGGGGHRWGHLQQIPKETRVVNGDELTYRMDRRDMEPSDRLLKDQPRLQTLLCGANGESSEADGPGELPKRV